MKASSRYPTLLMGVSQQTPNARLPGQHTEQVNLIPDPVVQLARRWGSVFTARGPFDGVASESVNSRTVTYRFDGKDYVVCLPLVGTSVPAIVYNKTDAKVMELAFSLSDKPVADLVASGVSAVTTLGRYTIIAANDSRIKLEDTSPLWDSVGVASPYAALWVRAGAYDRKFVVTVSRPSLPDVVLEYRTPVANFPGTLDVSGVPANTLAAGGGTETTIETAFAETYPGAIGDAGRHRLNYYQWTPTALTCAREGVAMTNVHPAKPTTASQFAWVSGDDYVYTFDTTDVDTPVVTISYTHLKVEANPSYTSLVSALTAKYNSDVSAWIVSSATAIMADNIAIAIKDLAVAAGLTATAENGHVYFSDVSNVVATDGGDDTLIRVAAHTVRDVADLTSRHHVGHVVRVKPGTSGDVYYMVATAKIEGGPDWQEVLWVEGQRQVRQLTGGFILGSPDPETNTFYLASPEYMDTLRVPVYDGPTRVTPDVPEFIASTVGDEDSDVSPYFVNRQINYLGVFQDRLLVGSDGVIRASATGDYFNFYRSSVLTEAASDPLEMLSKGSDDDIIRYSVEHEKNLLLFGNKQYLIAGQSILSPTNAVMPTLGNHKGADTMQPVAQSGLVFYIKRSARGSTAYQLQPGAYAETFDSYVITPHLSTYIPKDVQEISFVAEPSMLLVRHANTSKLTVFHYLDASDKRQQAAWYSWKYSDACGKLVSAVQVNGDVLLIWIRGSEVVVDIQPLNSGLSDRPYLDSQVPIGDYAPWATHTADALTFIGGEVSEDVVGDDKYSGIMFDAYVELSPPFQLDQQGRSKLNNDLVVSQVNFDLADSAGCVVNIDGEDLILTPEVVDLAVPDTTPVTNEVVCVAIGQRNVDYSLTIKSRLWLPLTITAVYWTGQIFNRTPEV